MKGRKSGTLIERSLSLHENSFWECFEPCCTTDLQSKTITSSTCDIGQSLIVYFGDHESIATLCWQVWAGELRLLCLPSHRCIFFFSGRNCAKASFCLSPSRSLFIKSLENAPNVWNLILTKLKLSTPHDLPFHSENHVLNRAYQHATDARACVYSMFALYRPIERSCKCQSSCRCHMSPAAVHCRLFSVLP